MNSALNYVVQNCGKSRKFFRECEILIVVSSLALFHPEFNIFAKIQTEQK